MSISGLLLSEPVPVTGLVGLYPANNLIGRSPILGPYRFEPLPIPEAMTYRGLATVSRGYPRP